MQHHTIFAIFLILFETSLGSELASVELEPYNEIIPGAWILYIPAGIEAAKRIADAEGFQNVYEIPDLNLFHLYDLKPSEDTEEEHISIRLTKYEEIKYMTPSTREKVEPRQRPVLKRQLSMNREDYYYCAGPTNGYYASDRPQFYSDPLYKKQWFLRSCSDLTGEDKPSYYDMKIVQTWEHFKLNGEGIIVLVNDNGVFAKHVELSYRVSMAYSKNYITGRSDPTPTDLSEDHGTMCAGIIAAEANNGVCGAGIANKATIGGQKYMDNGQFIMPHKVEALKYKAERVHIVSMSTGDFESKAYIMMEKELVPAIEYGIKNGRGGKGIIYVFSSGNGKDEDENCSSDGGLQTIYKIAVGGAKNNGDFSDYAEGCPAVMVVTHSGNGDPYAHVTPSTQDADSCTTNFNGTSAGCPVAAAIIALVLQANNNLTWRDVKHAIAWTSEVAPLAKNPGWSKNGAGFYVNYDVGFGLMNAYEMVELAKNFPGTSPPMNECVVPYTLRPDEKNINGSQGRSIRIPTNGCQGTAQEINYIEHVLVTATISYMPRGNLKIMLKSPQKTVTQLLAPRKRDQTNLPIYDFSFLSVHNWGEQPQGAWVVDIMDAMGAGGYGQIKSIELTFYGTQEQPELYKNGPRKYYPFTLPY